MRLPRRNFFQTWNASAIQLTPVFVPHKNSRYPAEDNPDFNGGRWVLPDAEIQSMCHSFLLANCEPCTHSPATPQLLALLSVARWMHTPVPKALSTDDLEGQMMLGRDLQLEATLSDARFRTEIDGSEKVVLSCSIDVLPPTVAAPDQDCRLMQAVLLQVLVDHVATRLPLLKALSSAPRGSAACSSNGDAGPAPQHLRIAHVHLERSSLPSQRGLQLHRA
mmetsp:Transcript_78601/g.230632  ORF Transcript_78601/g.230632 Transcript_78601/m.230632 type:complete len:221 (-) Transcript_78601:29-691(-)